ncbi:choice-of-anchor D domain-containing protein [candidate division KSB1 bacterium]|nr:choice-of-anchor D domain-containing protein [candidate division KSB1 bacterium]
MNRKNFIIILLAAVLIVPVGFTKVEPLAGQEINHVTKNMEKGQLLNSSSPEFSSFTLPPALRHRTNQQGAEPEILKKTPQITQEINTPTTAAGWTTIMSENFEGDFPGNKWGIYYHNNSAQAGYGYTWDDDAYLPHSGLWSGWCADENYTGLPDLDPAVDNYPNNTIAWMVYGPFNLSDATDAELLFYYWNQSESNYDYFHCCASIDDNQYYGPRWSGNSNGWVSVNFDLTNVNTLGNLCGKSQVWIAFIFQSDGSNNYKGAFVDDIVLQKNVTTPEEIIVTSPNGGEIWAGGSTHNITWTSSGTSGTVKIEYSTNSGTNWTPIASSTADDGTYAWTIPGTQSTNCLVKITDTDGNPSDQSDGTFEIRVESFTVTAPNGGEIWDAGSTQNITWTSSGTSGTVKIEYSTDSGSGWTTITPGVTNVGTYAWTIPNTPSVYCFVKLTDSDGYPSDQSNNVFTIRRLTESITVTSPNGGENWIVGSNHDLTWASTGTSGTVKIDYSTNNGSSWTTIRSSTPDDGRFTWTVPNAPTATPTCLIRITDTDGSISDVSDAPFTISGGAVPDIAIDPTAWNFGDVNLGVFADKSFIISNTGTGNLNVTATTLSGTNAAEFSIQSGGAPFTLIPGATHSLTVRFAPTSLNNKSANLNIASNDPDAAENPLVVNLSGKGISVPATGWEARLNITGGTWNYVRTFGGAASATDGYDVGIDQPAAPPGMTYYAFFQLPVFPTYLDKDIRQWSAPFELVLEWTLILTNASNVVTQLTWNPAELPAEGTFMLTGGGLNVNMRAVNNASVPGNATLIIKYQKVTVVTVPYNFSQAGWYLISLPVTPADNHLNILFPTALGAYGYNPATGSYVTATQLDPKKGYWLLIPGATSVNVSGEPLLSFTEHYNAGWHLIGSSYGTGLPIVDPDDAPNGAVIAIYGWNPGMSSYTPVYPPGMGVLNQGEGYWLAVLAACDLTIPGAPPLARNGATVNADLPQFFQQYGIQPPPPPFIQNEALPRLAPIQHEISCNYPNPFNPATTIKYTLSKTGFTGVYVYNTIGQRIRTLSEATQAIGIYEVVWDSRNESGEFVPSGIYFYQIVTSDFVETKKMMLLK